MDWVNCRCDHGTIRKTAGETAFAIRNTAIRKLELIVLQRCAAGDAWLSLSIKNTCAFHNLRDISVQLLVLDFV